MRKTLVMLAAVLFATGIALAEDKTLLIDDFEGAISGGPSGTVDFGAGNGSSLVVTAATEQAHSGKQSLKADFDAVSGGYMWIARGSGLDAKNAGWLIKPEDIKWREYNAISFWMYGSGSKVRVAFDIKDSGNEIWRFIATDDFKGWKQVICKFTEFFARSDWQPDAAEKNGVVDFPLKSYQLEPLPVAKGALYFDEVTLTLVQQKQNGQTGDQKP